MPGIPDSEWPKIRRMIDKGAVLREIAGEYGTSIATASKFVRAHKEANFVDRIKPLPADRPTLRVVEGSTSPTTVPTAGLGEGNFQMMDAARLLAEGVTILLDPNPEKRNQIALTALADRLVALSVYLKMNQ